MELECSQAIAYLKAVRRDEPEVGERVMQLSHSDSPVLRPFLPGLDVAYVVDRGESFSVIQNRYLSDENISLETLHQLAVENLRQLALSRLQLHEYGGIFACLLGGNFEASLILLDGLWDTGFRHVVQHDFVAAVPARDILAFCDSESAAGIRELRHVIDRAWPGGDHLLSRSLFRRRGSIWEATEDDLGLAGTPR